MWRTPRGSLLVLVAVAALSCCCRSRLAVDASIVLSQQQQANKTTTTSSPASNLAREPQATKQPSGSDEEEDDGGAAKRDKATTNAPREDDRYSLPSYFDYDAYKRLFGKRYDAGPSVDVVALEKELHGRIYLRTALKVYEQRAQYRANRLDALASVNELSDLVSC